MADHPADQPLDSGRREFLKTGPLAAGSLALTASLLPTIMSAGTQPVRITSQKFKSWETVDQPDGPEHKGQFEITDDHGKTHTINLFVKQISHSDGYTVINRVSGMSGGGVTCILQGTRGDTNGDFRQDTVSSTIITDNGAVQHQAARTVPVRVVNPYEGMSVHEQVDSFLRDKAAGRFPHQH